MFVRAPERKQVTATEDRLDKRTRTVVMSRVLMFAMLPAGGIVSLAAAEHQGGGWRPRSENSPGRLIFDSAGHKFGG
jgi:hypothetical protein